MLQYSTIWHKLKFPIAVDSLYCFLFLVSHILIHYTCLSIFQTCFTNKWTNMTNSAHDPDLDPLIKPFRAKGIIINRREHRTHVEKWGRIRLGIISICMFFVIYICFAVSTWSEQRPQIIVNIPPNDESLPGPIGKFYYSISDWFCFVCFFLSFHHEIFNTQSFSQLV